MAKQIMETGPVIVFTTANPAHRRDFKSQQLCNPCWNGQHHHRKVNEYGKAYGKIIIDCLAGECECFCRTILAERRRKPAKAKDPAVTARELEKKRTARADPPDVQYSLFDQQTGIDRGAFTPAA